MYVIVQNCLDIAFSNLRCLIVLSYSDSVFPFLTVRLLPSISGATLAGILMMVVNYDCASMKFFFADWPDRNLSEAKQ